MELNVSGLLVFLSLHKYHDRKAALLQPPKRYTKGLRPWEIVYRETKENWTEARKREKYLKSGVGKEYLKALVI